MTARRAMYLMTSALSVVTMVTAPVAARAQNGAPDSGYGQSTAGDPPARVGRLAVLQGTVSTHGAEDDHWSPAILNTPIFTGNALWTEPQALAEVEVTGSSLWMDGSTEFDLTTLDDTSMHAATPQGELYLHLHSLAPNEVYTLETPRGTVSLATDGRYDIVAGDTEHPTQITVLDGAAQVTGNNISLQVHANQTASIDGATTFQGSVGPATQDAFLTAMLQREQPPVARGVAAPAVVSQMTGCQDLARYGDWQDNADNGPVWYPQVAADWVPYRDGRWSYVAPWGWTWVDNAPWGFAPFHYGRWQQYGGRWGWTPAYGGYGERERPVYAPALVGFFGLGAGIGIGIGLHAAFGPGDHIGWVPLGPREAYYPPYRASRGYLDRVNVTNIRNVTNIYQGAGERDRLGVDHFANNRFATVVPGRAMENSQPIRGAFTRVTPAELAGAKAFTGRPPIAPGPRTEGLTPRVAEQMNVRGVEQRRAPGPAVVAEAGPHAATPMLRPGRGGPAAPGPQLRPNGAPGPQLRGAPPPGGLPPLRAPEKTRPGRDAGAVGAPGPHIAPPVAGAHPDLRTPGATPAAPHAGMPAGPATGQRPTTTPPPGPRPAEPPRAARPLAPPRPAMPQSPVTRPVPQRAPMQRPSAGANLRQPPQASAPHVVQPRAQPQFSRPMPPPPRPQPQMQRPPAMRPQPMPQQPRPQPQTPPQRPPQGQPKPDHKPH